MRRNYGPPRRHVPAIAEPLVARLENTYSARSEAGVRLSAGTPKRRPRGGAGEVTTGGWRRKVLSRTWPRWGGRTSSDESERPAECRHDERLHQSMTDIGQGSDPMREAPLPAQGGGQ